MAVTVVHHASEPGAVVRRREAGELIVEAIPPTRPAAGSPSATATSRRAGVELVEVGLPNPFLARGIALVDTPGVGGLNAAHAAATLAFLPSADALVFVTDASTELSGPELEFLASARSAGPPILVAVTKVDIYPAWRRIVEIDAGRLEALGLADAPYPLSSVLRTRAVATGDDDLETESGFPVFARALADDAVGRARTAALAAAVRAVAPVLDQLREPLAAEQAVLDHPETAEALTADLRAARARLAALADADASWSVRLEDEYTALRSRTGFAFQARMRQRLDAPGRDRQDRPAREWPAVSQRIQAETARRSGPPSSRRPTAPPIQATIARLLADEASALQGVGTDVSFDVATLWQGGPTFEGRTRQGIMASLGMVGGATVGVEMLGMLGTLLGAAVVGPAAIGVAAVFGGKEVLDSRRRQLADRRQQARSFLATFLGVRFEADGRLVSLLDDLQRQMRARFADRISELRRTVAETTDALESATAQADTARRARLAELAADLASIDALRERVRRLDGGDPASGGTIAGASRLDPGARRLLSQGLSIVLWRGSRGTVAR